MQLKMENNFWRNENHKDFWFFTLLAYYFYSRNILKLFYT